MKAIVSGVRVGFKLEAYGLFSWGISYGFLAIERYIQGTHIRELYVLRSLGQGANFLGGAISTVPGGFVLPAQGDTGTLPVTINFLDNRMVHFQLTSSAWFNTPGILDFEIGQVAHRNGTSVYVKEGLNIIVNNGVGDVEVICGTHHLNLQDVYPDRINGFRRGQEIWNDILLP